MKKLRNLIITAGLFIVSTLALSGCTCGFDCSSDDDDAADPVLLTLLFSDSLPDELTEVVLSVDRIEWVRDDGATTTVDRFSIDSLALIDEDSFEVDLLTLSGDNALTVFEDLELAPDFYDEVNIYPSDANLDRSFVLDALGTRSPLFVSGGVLSIPGRQLNSGSSEFVIEFGLARALRFVSEAQGYQLTTQGLSLQNTASTVNLNGSIDADLLDGTDACSWKAEPTAFNRVYLYRDEDVTAGSLLGDVHIASASDTEVPDNAVAPYAVASLVESATPDRPLNYFFSYLPQGSYTLALACNAQDDDPIDYDGITVAEPETQVYSLELPTAGETYLCNLAPEADCDNAATPGPANSQL